MRCLRYQKSQSHRTAQGNSKVVQFHLPSSFLAKNPSQSHRTAHCNSKDARLHQSRDGQKADGRNPTVVLRAIPSPPDPRGGASGSAVAIPPYCSGQFQVSGDPQDIAVIDKSQSHRTAQGNSKDARLHQSRDGQKADGRNPTVVLRAIPSPPDPRGGASGSAVAIPPYCSGQFQVSGDPQDIAVIDKSQSHRTAQGNSKNSLRLRLTSLDRRRNPTVQLRAIPRQTPHPQNCLQTRSQSHGNAQGNSKLDGVAGLPGRDRVAILQYCSGPSKLGWHPSWPWLGNSKPPDSQ